MTPEAPSQIWLALAAVCLPFSAISLTPLMPSRLRHHFRAGELAEHDVRIFLLDARALVMAKTVLGGELRSKTHRHPRHRFNAGGDHDVHRAGHHGLGRKMQRLLRRAALAVDRGGGNAFRELRSHHGVARDVVGLLAGLHHAAHDHVLDLGGIDLGAVDQRIQHGSGKIGRMPACETSALAAARGTRGGDDIGLGHVCSPLDCCWWVFEGWAGFKGGCGI
jgi:hypothetical protein